MGLQEKNQMWGDNGFITTYVCQRTNLKYTIHFSGKYLVAVSVSGKSLSGQY